MYRTQSLISGGGDVLCGGIVDEDDKFISPTIMTSELTYPALLPLRCVTLPPTLTIPCLQTSLPTRRLCRRRYSARCCP